MNKNKNFFAAILIVIAAIFASPLKAQVTIGEQKKPENFSVLELISNGKSGLRLPQLTTGERDAITTAAFKANDKAEGLAIFNTTTNCVNIWNGEVWIEWCAQQSVPPLTTTAAITEINDDVPDCTGAIANNGWTNDNAPTVKGTLDAALGNGESVAIYRSDNGGTAVKLSGTATVTGTDWTYNDSGLLSGHTYAYTAKVVSAGGESVFSNAWSIQVDTDRPTQIATIDTYTDDQEPQTGVFDFSVPTNDQTPLISGTLSSPLAANETLALYRATGAGTAVKVATLTVNGDLTWTYQETTPLPATAGTVYTYTARVEDAACNYGDYSVQAKLTLDTKAPLKPSLDTVVDNVSDMLAFQGPVARITGQCNDPMPTINGGDGEPGCTMFIYDNGNLIGSTIVDINGNWVFIKNSNNPYQGGGTYNTPLTDGAKVLTAVCVDAAGNVSAASNPFRFTQDTTPPTQLVTMVDFVDAVGPVQGVRLSGAQTDDPRPTLRGTIVDQYGQPATLAPGEMVQISSYPNWNNLVGYATVDASGSSWTFRIPTPGLVDHSLNIFQAMVIDAAGNAGPPYPSSADTNNQFTIKVELSGGY